MVQSVIDRYGKMQEILTDSGFIFYSWRGINRFERFLQTQGIDHNHARPHHLQILGKVEACNRRLKQELNSQQHFSNVDDCPSGHWQLGLQIQQSAHPPSRRGTGGACGTLPWQADQVLAVVSKGIDVCANHCYSFCGIERSMINLVRSPNVKLTLYLLGQPILATGGEHVLETQCRGSGRGD